MTRFASFALTLLIAQSSVAQVAVSYGYGFSFGGSRAQISGWATGSSFHSPYFGPTYRHWVPYAPAPLIVIVPQPIIVVPAHYELHGFAERPSEPPLRPNRDRWHVVKPANPVPFPVVPRPELLPNAPVAALGDRLPDGNRESARQVKLALAAFATTEYGRAAERLNEAIQWTPNEPLPYFLLAQVRLARGEYAESVAAIRDGLTIAPDWPASTFTPKPLYSTDPGVFDRHLAELKQATERNPHDRTAQFLLAYQLWFTGDRNEATKHFQQLLPLVKDRALVEAFLVVAAARLVKR